MEAKLFKDLTKILAAEIEEVGSGAVGSALSKTVLKYANKAQATKLAKDFETLYTTSKAGKISTRRAPKEPEGTKVVIQPGDLTSERVGIVLGGYGHEAGAQQAAQQFLHPNVFQYQSALFPDPRTHNVTVTMDKATALELKGETNPLYPWGVRLELEVAGPKGKVASWIQQFMNQIRIHSTKS